MIPTIIYLVLRRFRRSNPEKAARIVRLIRKVGFIIFLCLVLLGISIAARSQQSRLDYLVTRKGREIGSLIFTQEQTAGKTMLKIESTIKAQVVFLFTIKALEEATYENGFMTSSFLYRKMNGKEKLNKKTWLTGRNYIITKGNRSETFDNYPIRYNMSCLFSQEPVTFTKVYSDNFQRFLNIQQLGAHHYRIDFPDGNHNEYYYVNGVCSRMEVKHGIYNVTMQLR